MRTVFDPKLRAQITFDDANRIRNITHLEPQPEVSIPEAMAEGEGTETATARDVAVAYVGKMASILQLPSEQLEALGESATNIEPQQRPVQYRVAQEKTLFDATTVGFAQTVHEIPVWESGISVVVRHGPYRVVSAEDNTTAANPDPKMPPLAIIETYQKLFAIAEGEQKLRETRRKFGEAAAEIGESPTLPRTAEFVRRVFRVADDVPVHVIRGRFFVYRYDPEERLPRLEANPESVDQTPPRLPFDLPPVPDSIVPWAWYVVAEITFSHRNLTWLALIELETETVLHLRPMFSAVNGMVFLTDPLTSTGVAANTADRPSSVLNPLRSSVLLRNLTAPANGKQALRGTRAVLSDQHPPAIAAPTRPTGTDFDFDVRTDDFAAVCAYYHVDEFFRTVESLGFPLNTYFNDTNFPIDVDHRAHISDSTPKNGLEINAHCDSNGHGGIGHVCFALGDLSDTGNPLGRACDSRVFWHELGGHGVLYEFVNWANFKFAHSAGDSLSAIFHAPDSRAPDPRRYAPWNPNNDRRNDRDVAAGWAWGGAKDKGMKAGGGYASEEILATTMFRAYLAIGGDDRDDLARRRFASRMMLYLILRAISTFTPATNPDHAMKFANALISADLADWTSERINGGAYGKVIRWAFEKQGLYQSPGAPTTVTTPGAPPDVDVYIDDGRGGEYEYARNHANTTTIWNRLAPDNLVTHQRPRLGVTNHAYVKLRNRGPNTATGVRVRAFHSRAGAGVSWPNDFQPMTTASINVGTLDGDKTQERVVGPFAWTPVRNSAGNDAMLMIVTAAEDPSNADFFTATRPIEDWRLVPNDNGIGQRNVEPV